MLCTLVTASAWLLHCVCMACALDEANGGLGDGTCGKRAPQDTGCMSCMCLTAQDERCVLKVVNCHKTPCKPACRWLGAYWLGLSQEY